jgi:sugar lactone lactonase YvrE
LYVLQGYTGSVTKIPISNCVPQASAQSSISVGNLGAISYYWGGSAVSADSTGDVFIATSDACCASKNELLAEYTGYPQTLGATLLASLANPITAIAIDASDNIYYVSGGALYELKVTTAATSTTPQVYSSTPVKFGNGYVSAVGVSIDGSGNLYVADQGTGGQYAINGYYPPLYFSSVLYVSPNETSGLNPTDQYIVVEGSGLSNPLTFANAVAISPSGNVFFTDNGSDNSVYELTEGSGSFGAVAVGNTGSATVNVVFNAAATPASIQFAHSSTISSTGGTCAAGTNYAAGSTCTVTAHFAPAAPGVSTGGITLAGSSGAALATVELEGIGLGAGLTLDPGVPSSFGSGFKSPMSVAIDSAGDTFFADAGNNAILEFKSGSSTAVSIGTGLSKPAGVAVDGAGNVFIADTGNNRIVEVPMVNGSLSNSAQTILSTTLAGTALSGPAAVAVDGAGDLFIADTGNNRIVAVPFNGTLNVSAATALGSSFSGPLAMAVDPIGNLYVANSGVGQIEKILYPLYQPTQQLVAVGFGNPTGLAVDASGSLFVADYINGDVERIPNVSGSLEPNSLVEAGIGVSTPYGVALDASGNLYISNGSGGSAYKITRTNTTLAFGDWALNTPSGLLAAQVEDAGNQPLILGTPYFTATGNTGDFSVSATGSGICAAGGTVASGASCELDATFTPSASGARTDTLTLASNAANAATTQVTLTGSGTATAATTTKLTVTSPASGSPFFGQAITLSATVTATSGTPSGTATLVVDGVQFGDATLSASGVATFNLASGLTGGGHTLIAVYNGTATFNGSVSSALQLTVGKTTTATALVVTAPYTNPYSALPGNTITFTAAIGFAGVGIPTGTVTFAANGKTLGSASVVPAAGGIFEATYSTSSLVVGNYTVVATYSGDPNYIGSVSAASAAIYVVTSPIVTTTSSGTSITSSSSSNSTVAFTSTGYGGWNGLVGFSCLASSLPANARCIFSPGQIEVLPSTPTTTASNPAIAMSVVIDQPPQTPTASKFLWWLAGPTGLLLLFARRRFARRTWSTIATTLVFILFGIAAGGMGACTGGISYTTPPGAGTVTVYAWSDPYTTMPTPSTANPPTQACGMIPASNPPQYSPALAPCSQTTFQVSLTVQ